MQVLIPQTLKILNDTVPENEAPLWDKTVAYTKGQSVIYDHYVYKAVDAAAAGVVPVDNCDADGMPWQTVSVTNRYACLDIYNWTQTKAEGAQTLTIQVPYALPATGLALLNMQATRVTVTITNTSGETVYGGEPVALLKDSISQWDYWFGPFRFQRDLVLTSIPPATGTVTVTLEHDTCPAIGMIVVGQHAIFGVTEYGVRSGFVDYSSYTTDTYGREAWVKRRTARRATFPVWIDPGDADYVQDILTDLAGNPALWIGDDGAGFSSMTIWGFLKEYDANWETYGKTAGNFEVRGIA